MNKNKPQKELKQVFESQHPVTERLPRLPGETRSNVSYTPFQGCGRSPPGGKVPARPALAPPRGRGAPGAGRAGPCRAGRRGRPSS